METMSFYDLNKKVQQQKRNDKALKRSVKSINDSVNKRLNSKSTENYYDFSLEEEKNKHMVDAKNAQKHSLLDKIKELPSKANLISQNFQLWARKRKNLGFYKKYLDRVESGLYDKYSGEARVKENRMIDDPVVILKDRAKIYIHDIVEGINSVYKNLLNVTKELENEVNSDKCIQIIDKYIGKDIVDQNIKGEKANTKSYKDKILNATKLKIAKVLMENGNRRVYGYTVKNMVLKGYPTPNHLIVTLFVDNPEEAPQEQSVNEIFKSTESFDIIGDSDKQDIFNVGNMTKAALNKTVDDKVMNTIEMFKSNALNKFKSAALDNKKEQGKIIDQIWDGIKLSSKELLSRKAYIIDCINIYYQMILRIDNLAIRAIKSMLAQENLNLDDRYKKDLKIGQMSDRQRRKEGYWIDEDFERQRKKQNNHDIARTGRLLNSSVGQAVRTHR